MNELILDYAEKVTQLNKLCKKSKETTEWALLEGTRQTYIKVINDLLKLAIEKGEAYPYNLESITNPESTYFDYWRVPNSDDLKELTYAKN